MPTVTPALAARRKAVFAACRQLGLDEEARRAMLKSVAGVDSTTQLTMPLAQTVLDHLRKAGADRPKPVRGVGRHPGDPGRVRPACDALVGKIEAQLADMGLSWEYARSILRRVSGGWKQEGQLGKEAFVWAEPDDLKKVVAALAYEQEKRALLDHIDQRLAATGRTRADVLALVLGPQAIPPRGWAGWERKPALLRQVAAALLRENIAPAAAGGPKDCDAQLVKRQNRAERSHA